MAILNTWQRISRVISGRPFGNGSAGPYNSSTVPTMTRLSFTGTEAESHIHATSGTFSSGDVVLLHQTRGGTNPGKWEIEMITADNADGSYNVSSPLNYSYASGAQCIKIPLYSDVTLPSGTWTVPSWSSSSLHGGILVFAANGTVTISGAIDGSGANGSTATCDVPDTSGIGFGGGGGHEKHGAGSSCHNPAEHLTQVMHCGEGTGGPQAEQNGANGNGGGGGGRSGASGTGGGAGGGNANAGSNATGDYPGTGGSSAGSADLTSIVLGGGGGGNSENYSYSQGQGGVGGGMVMIFGKIINEITGTITLKGGNGGGTGNDGAGGGAGGSCLIACQTAILGSSKVTANQGTASGLGGSGSVGRIAVHHSGGITGSTSPAIVTDINDITDGSMIEEYATIPNYVYYG